MNAGFKFELKQVVKLSESGETGTVIARCQFVDASNSYQLRYKAGDGRMVETWWYEGALEAV